MKRGCKLLVRIDPSWAMFKLGKQDKTVVKDLRDVIDSLKKAAELLDIHIDRIYQTLDADRLASYRSRFETLQRAGMMRKPLPPAYYHTLEMPPVAMDIIRGPVGPTACHVWRDDHPQPVTTLVSVVDFIDFDVPLHIRGVDMLNALAPEALLSKALGVRTISYAHIPMISDPAGKKLDKQTPEHSRYEFPKWAAQFKGPDEIRNALEELIFPDEGRELCDSSKLYIVPIKWDG